MLNINNIIEHSTQKKCKSCQNNLFIPGYYILEVPASLAPTGVMSLAPTMAVFICSECGEELITTENEKDENTSNS